MRLEGERGSEWSKLLSLFPVSEGQAFGGARSQSGRICGFTLSPAVSLVYKLRTLSNRE